LLFCFVNKTANINEKIVQFRIKCKSGQITHMVWYGMVSVDIYSAIVTKVSNSGG